jgi:hypothetical protein
VIGRWVSRPEPWAEKYAAGLGKGRADAAHIHAALAGKANPAPAFALCGPCKNGQTGTVTASVAVIKKILGGATYVNIHTPKNAAGEIRGQIASS